MNFPHYHEDMTHLHVGTLPSRAYFIPHGERDTALKGIRTDSTRMTLLSGTWRFGYYDSFLDLPEDLFSPAATPDAIPVPSIWQCHGYDAHQYVNARFPIPYDPPYVPVENPCGLYTRSFHWSAEEGESATLHFEGVDSCMYVWVNEQFVGYSQVAHSTSAFDVTSFLLSGENHITVLVLKWCDGTYFEDQDKFRQSGIFRDVYILRRSACHLTDYFVHTNLTDDFTIREKRLQLVIVGSITIDCRSGELDAMSSAFLKMAGVFSELELQMIRARVKSGMANAKAKGKRVGRRPTTKEDIPASFLKHYTIFMEGKMNVSELARVCGLSRPTVYKYLKMMG